MPVNMFLEQSQKADKWSGSTIEANLFEVNGMIIHKYFVWYLLKPMFLPI